MQPTTWEHDTKVSNLMVFEVFTSHIISGAAKPTKITNLLQVITNCHYYFQKSHDICSIMRRASYET